MELFYQSISDALMSYIVSIVLFSLVLVVVLRRIIQKSADRYPPKGIPTTAAFYAALVFFVWGQASYAQHSLQEIINSEVCPLAIPVLNNEVERLAFNDIKSIVSGCGVEFFENHSGRRLAELIPVISPY